MSNSTDLTDQEINSFINSNKWIFAKTMAHIPHEYCLKKNCCDQEIFDRFVMHIRRHGYEGRFFRRTYIYFDVGQYQYWTMGDPLHTTTLINRAIRK